MFVRQAQDTKQDRDLVFDLSNDPIVRKASFNTKLIEYEQHCKWYSKTILDKNILFFLVFEAEEFVGQIRFKRETEQSKECVISLSITKSFRGKHIAKQFMKVGIEEMQKKWRDIRSVIAEVKIDNVPSNAFFSKAGFELTSAANTYRLKMRSN